MHDSYYINTVNLYGLENYNSTTVDSLFNELNRLGMKAVVRIEAYDTNRFAFQTADLDYIMARYTSLIQYVSDSGRRGSVAYFALNMPVDDGSVQQRLDGINSATSKQRQPVYAAAFVQRMRSLLNSYGFTTAKLYLSVFYGWDKSYDIPSYQGSGADGYFLNNYSYPADSIPDDTVTDSVLINETGANGLKEAMDKFESQYLGCNQVIEYGFHTVEYNQGNIPQQTAGLVWSKKAKQKALQATTHYYRTHFSNVKGTLYFGYNLFKKEGSDNAEMDWALNYSAN
jgi:hypothetical protein